MSSIISISCFIAPLHKCSARAPYPNITSAMITVPIACNSKYVSNSICRSSRIVVQALTIEPRLWLSFLTLLTPLLAIMFFSTIHKNIATMKQYTASSNITLSQPKFLKLIKLGETYRALKKRWSTPKMSLTFPFLCCRIHLSAVLLGLILNFSNLVSCQNDHNKSIQK